MVGRAASGYRSSTSVVAATGRTGCNAEPVKLITPRGTTLPGPASASRKREERHLSPAPPRTGSIRRPFSSSLRRQTRHEPAFFAHIANQANSAFCRSWLRSGWGYDTWRYHWWKTIDASRPAVPQRGSVQTQVKSADDRRPRIGGRLREALDSGRATADKAGKSAQYHPPGCAAHAGSDEPMTRSRLFDRGEQPIAVAPTSTPA